MTYQPRHILLRISYDCNANLVVQCRISYNYGNYGKGVTMGSNEFRIAANVIEIIVAVAAILVLGDYMGYKFGRWKLATVTGLSVLGLVIIFAIYAVIVAVSNNG
jgi:hypothetical protein